MPENTDTCEEAQKRRDAEWEALMRLKKQGRWENRADAAKGIKSAVIQTVGWALEPAEHCQNRLDNIVLRNEMLFQCDWFRADPPCPFRVKAKEKEGGIWIIDGICPFHTDHPLDEDVEMRRPQLKMGNPDSSLTVSTSDNNDYRGSSCSGGMDLDVGLYRQRSSKGAVKRRRRDSSPPTTAYPYDEKLKAEHPPDSTATKLPKVGQKFKSCDAFERACANGTPEDSEWRLSNAYESESAIEKRCRHAKGFCTGDNFRVRAEAQSNGLWLVVRSIFLHDVGISAVFDNTLQTGGRGRRGAAATASSNSGRTPASHSPSPALSASQSGNSQASSSKSKASSKPTKKRSSTSTRPSFSKASSTAGSEDGSSAAASTPLSILPYKDLREGSPQTAPTDFLSAAASALPDVAVSHTSPPSSVYAGRTTRNSSSRVSSRHSSTDDAEDVTLVPFVPKASSSHAPESECQLPLASSSSSSSAMKSVPALSSLPLAFKDSPEMQEGLRQAELYKRRKLTSSSSSSSLKVKEEDFDQPIRSSLRNSSSSPNVRVEPEEDVKPVPHQAIADFLNSLLPPTDSDHGLGDLCGKALFDIGFSDQTALLPFTAVPHKFGQMCTKNAQLKDLLSEYEISLLKEHIVDWLKQKKAALGL